MNSMTEAKEFFKGGEYYYDLAENYSISKSTADKHYRRAIEYFERAISSESSSDDLNHADVYNYLSMCYGRLGNNDEAMKWSSKIAEKANEKDD